MTCRTNDTNTSVLWRRLTKDSSPQKIFTGQRLSTEHSHVYQVNSSLSGQYDLIINASLLLAKQYICQEGPFGHEDGNFGSCELIVLGKISLLVNMSHLIVTFCVIKTKVAMNEIKLRCPSLL